ncbi:GPI mannosyltransferase 1-like [Homarus americanus]|uniref:GPI mannosyltransferase 1-like n=1 Tax=Homarus americanus TaxID=6706 RepID=UPI001C4745FF|nr:GPI mannosyltransferase 1-like [Homarus americanus]
MGLGTRGSRFGSTEVIQIHLFLGFLVRLIFIVYGEHRDKTSTLKYTDVDYHVFTDASREIAAGGSPFDRHTYRYTPFLAWMLLPNIYIHSTFGKLMFSFFDCIASRLIYEVLLRDGQSKLAALKCSFMWLYNPLVIGVSTRGSAEAIMAVLVLFTLYMMKLRLNLLAGLFLGTSIHFKLYPIIYSLPLYLSLTSDLHQDYFWTRFLPTYSKMKLVMGTLISFFGLTGMGFAMYGEQYIEEAFLYHISRTDTRHNFSIYFYLLYIGADFHIPGLNVATFGPQIILLLALGYKFSNRVDVPFAMFTQTVVFVTFNKVVTSQYFLWYLLLLPIVVPRLRVTWQKAVLLSMLWIAAQVSWLLPAYLLEFHSINAFVPIWLEGIAFFCCNVGVLMALISSYTTLLPNQQHHSSRKNR